MVVTHQAAGGAAPAAPLPLATRPVYPAAVRLPLAEKLNDRHVPDPYRWLEDEEDLACGRWLEAQKRLLAAHAPSWSSRSYFRALLGELQGLGGAQVPVATPPVCRGALRFFLHRPRGAELPQLVVSDDREMQASAGRVLFDPMAADPGGLTFLTVWRPSWSGRLVACQLTRRGSESPELCVVDTASRRVADERLSLARPTPVAWLPDDSGFYYVTGAAGRRQVRLHLLGRGSSADLVVFETPHAHLSVAVSPDGRWLTVSSAPGAQTGNDLYLADLAARTAAGTGLRLIHHGSQERTSALLKSAPNGLLYAVTDAGAPCGRVCRVDPDRPHYAAWSTLITAGLEDLLTACTALTDPASGQTRFLVGTSHRGAARLALHDVAGRRLADVPAPGTGPGTISGLSTPPGGGGEVFFTYTDFVTPPAVYRFSARQGRCRPYTPPGIDGTSTRPAASASVPSPVVRHLTFRSHDGTEVGLYLIEPAALPEGPRPTILTAYGGFGALAAPAFSPTITAWVRAGGRYAIAQVRGGGEHGTAWHAAGSGVNKPSCFADFAAAADHLIDQGLTTPDRLAIKGSSHSGLVVAAALTRHPERYAAAVCSDAPTDMIRYPLMGIGPLWATEFGTPDDPEQLDVLLSYSPYHQVKPGTPYPAILLTGAHTDPRVGSAHIRKFTAALQYATTSPKPVLLRTEADVGHGQRTATRWADLTADTLAFCATHTGLTPPDHR
ncbi:prolyl oligopeptidase family serine peptidase [Streptomyces pilosus]|uniref:prolyl oligopeptidase family serine peptidase n=1 Tax=Streptomyces pilosus TaxID=28893 RepID=UPI0036CD4837